jgi:hypothetical protein
VSVKSGAGRQRFNVLGVLNAVTHELIIVTNEAITLPLDNARYQKCIVGFSQRHGMMCRVTWHNPSVERSFCWCLATIHRDG